MKIKKNDVTLKIEMMNNLYYIIYTLFINISEFHIVHMLSTNKSGVFNG